MGLPLLAKSDGFVVTPSRRPIAAAFLISSMSPESMKNFIFPHLRSSLYERYCRRLRRCVFAFVGRAIGGAMALLELLAAAAGAEAVPADFRRGACGGSGGLGQLPSGA